MPTSDFERCEFANWYPLFRRHVPKTRILEAPESFREYLLSDGITLYSESNNGSDSEWESDQVPKKETISTFKENDGTRSVRAPPAEFHHLIEKTIKELKGEVAPKLNWSAPKDSKWMNPSNTMRCTNANDIYILLKASDYINHDLQQSPTKLTLVLREWFDLHPSSEFRCFVRGGKLIGVSQRDMNFYQFLEQARKIIESLCQDLAKIITEKFDDDCFVFDVHIPDAWNRAWLVDINPWHETTDSLLFSWDELPRKNDFELRLVEKEDRSRTFSSKPHSTSQVPVEFVDMERGTLAEMIAQMKEQQKQEEANKG